MKRKFLLVALLYFAGRLIFTDKVSASACGQCQVSGGCTEQVECGSSDCWMGGSCWPSYCGNYCWEDGRYQFCCVDGGCTERFLCQGCCSNYCCVREVCVPGNDGASCSGGTGRCSGGGCVPLDPCPGQQCCGGKNCPSPLTCNGGSCGAPIPCGGSCPSGQTCIIDPGGFGECQETQASSCEPCAGGGTLYCTPNCSAGAQCWCTGNPSPACSGGNTSGCGPVDCPGSLGGYWTCNQGRCEAVCQQPGGSGGCTPGAATCTTCAGGRQQCDNGCSTYQQDCVSCVSTKPQKPIAISPSGETTAKNVALKYKSFSNLAEWGSFCPINTNSYTYYLAEESSPTLSTQVGTPYISNPPYQNNYCGGAAYPCDIVSPMFPVLYSRNYKWKVTACNGAGSCTDSDIMHFTVRDSPGWWQTVGGGDVYGVDVQSEIGENASPALLILN